VSSIALPRSDHGWEAPQPGPRHATLAGPASGLQTDDPEQWHLYAATTLLSGIVLSAAPRAEQDTRLRIPIQRHNM
jgi:hypothetical protein